MSDRYSARSEDSDRLRARSSDDVLYGAKRQYGLLLPHFGEHVSPEALVDGARLAERLGFDSVWVRDHLIFHPHGMEGQDRTHLDPLVVLSWVGAATERLILGTGSLIPHRHPIQLAGALASLSVLAGGRVIVGMGLGSFDHEFEAIGLGEADRGELMAEQIAIVRRLWTGQPVTHEGKHYRFADVDIHPSPRGHIPFWYCGGSLAAVRRAVEMCEGYMPGRITLKTFARNVRRMRRLAGEQGKPVPTAAAIPITSPGRTREDALSKVNLAGFLEEANRHGRWIPPASGKFETADDLEGALIAGPPSSIAEVAEGYHAAGCEHLVFDLRFRFDEWLECVQLLGEEVLPLLRGAATAKA